MKKNKLIDRLKSWLVTLGIASVFGLAALGVNAANSYQKASAYEYQADGDLILANDILFDFDILNHYVLSSPLLYLDAYHYVSLQLSNYDFVDNDDEDNYYWLTSYVLSDEIGSLYFAESLLSFGSDSNYFSLIWDESLEIWNIDEIFSSRYSADGYSGCFCKPSYEGYQSLRNYVLSYNAPQESGNFVTALTSFMSLIGGGIVQLAQSVGAGVVGFASSLFIDNSHLSIMGGIIGIFAGIALAVGITSKVYVWVSTLGN